MEKKFVYAFNSNLSQTGGSEESTKNILSYPRDGKKIIFVSPYKSPPDIHVDQEFVTPFNKISKNIPKIVYQKPDGIILNSPNEWTTSLLYSLPKELQEKSCAIWRGTIESSRFIKNNSPDNKFVNFISDSIVTKLQNVIGNKVKFNLAVSSAVNQSLQQAGVPKEKIINIQEQLSNKYNPEIRNNNLENERKNFLKPDEFGVLFVGRIAPEKGIDWLVNLYKNLKSEIKYFDSDIFPKIKINVVGTTDLNYFKFIKRQIDSITAKSKDNFKSDNVNFEFWGCKNSDQLKKFYNTHDVLFMPSPSEGFGHVTVEALSSGLPVIGRSGCIATEEILSNPPYSVGTVVDNVKEATREIFFLANNSETLDQLKTNAYKWASNFYSSQKAKDQLWQAIDQL